MYTRVTKNPVLGGLVLLTALTVLLGGCQEEEAMVDKVETPRNVRVLVLEPQAMDQYFEVSGPVAPVRGTVLSAQESGPVVDIRVAKGAWVKAGAVILEQDRAILAADKASAAAELSTQAYNVDKVRQLFEAGKVSRMELLQAESAYEGALSRADISAKRHERAAITAPFAGIVTDRYVELGQMMGPGLPAVRLIDPSVLKLETYLTDVQVQWVRPGQSAVVELGKRGTSAKGAVTWVGLEADRQTGKFMLEIEIPNPDGTLFSGVIGRARLQKARVEDALLVPRDAVLSGPDGPMVFVTDGQNVRRRNIKLGQSQGLMVAVLEGLAPGDSLVVRGQREVREGGRVRVTQLADRTDGSRTDDPQEIGQDEAGSRIRAAEPSGEQD